MQQSAEAALSALCIRRVPTPTSNATNVAAAMAAVKFRPTVHRIRSGVLAQRVAALSRRPDNATS